MGKISKDNSERKGRKPDYVQPHTCIIAGLCCTIQVSEAIQFGEDEEAQGERDLTEVQEQVYVV